MKDTSRLIVELTAWATQRDVRPSAKTALQLREMARQVNSELARLRAAEDRARELLDNFAPPVGGEYGRGVHAAARRILGVET